MQQEQSASSGRAAANYRRAGSQVQVRDQSSQEEVRDRHPRVRDPNRCAEPQQRRAGQGQQISVQPRQRNAQRFIYNNDFTYYVS